MSAKVRLQGTPLEGYDPALSFGAAEAERYDATNVRGDERETVDFLARLAEEGPALELAIGTGRIGLPLAERGIRVDGIELSPEMVAQLKKKPGSERIAVTIGDMADCAVEGRYRLIYVVYNTFFNLLTQDDQVRCFANVAKHLTDDGVFVIEAFEPGWLHRLAHNQYVHAEGIGIGHVKLDVARHDPIGQLLEESHVTLAPEGIRVAPIVCRYCWPSELDLMARLAGLRLHQRWGGWLGEPFTATSERHVSVWGR